MVLKYLKGMEIWMEVEENQAVTTTLVAFDFESLPSTSDQHPLLLQNLYGSLLPRENVNILAFLHSPFPSHMIVFKK